MTELELNEYKELLSKATNYSDGADLEERENAKKLLAFLNDIKPQKLYRFRSCNEQNFSAFVKDEIWLSSANCFNDDFDGLFYCEKEKVKDHLKSCFLEDRRLEALDLLSKTSDEDLENKPLLITLRNEIKDIPEEERRVHGRIMFDSIKSRLDSFIKNGADTAQETNYIACFSENITSPTMWGHYGDCSTGFALGYDLKSNPIIWTTLFPLIYTEQRYNATEFACYVAEDQLLLEAFHLLLSFRASFVANWYMHKYCRFDPYELIRVIVHKNSDWDYESEWRLIQLLAPNEYKGESHYPIEVKPCAVYLGREISDINKLIVTKFSKEKKIPVYQMEVDYTSNKFELKPVLIDS